MGCKHNDKILFAARDLIYGVPGDFYVVKCLECGLIRTNPRPTLASIGDYYPDSYGPYSGSRVNEVLGGGKISVKGQIKGVVSNLFKHSRGNISGIRPGRLLEVGCASGSFLHKMAKEGWRVNGIEFSPAAAKAAQSLGYSVLVGAVEDAPVPDELYDLIVGWMVLEHLHDPLSVLKKFHSWAGLDATLALSVPNAGALDFKIFRDKSYALQVPTHMYHFTPKTLVMILREAGWQVQALYHQRTLSNYMGSLGLVLGGNGNPLGRLFLDYTETGWCGTSYLLYPLSWLMGIMGQTGRMTVIARKLK